MWFDKDTQLLFGAEDLDPETAAWFGPNLGLLEGDEDGDGISNGEDDDIDGDKIPNLEDSDPLVPADEEDTEDEDEEEEDDPRTSDDTEPDNEASTSRFSRWKR